MEKKKGKKGFSPGVREGRLDRKNQEVLVLPEENEDDMKDDLKENIQHFPRNISTVEICQSIK